MNMFGGGGGSSTDHHIRHTYEPLLAKKLLNLVHIWLLIIYSAIYCQYMSLGTSQCFAKDSVMEKAILALKMRVFLHDYILYSV